MSESTTPRNDAGNCFVCGPDNSLGLQVQFELDGGVCRGRFTPGEDHCGFDGITHGGIIFSLLDDVMANCLFLKGQRCFTAKCEIRFRSQLPTGAEVLLEARPVKEKRHVVVMEGIATRAETSEVVAETVASFVVVKS